MGVQAPSQLQEIDSMKKLYDSVMIVAIVAGLSIALTVRPSADTVAHYDAREAIVVSYGQSEIDCHNCEGFTDSDVGCIDDCLDSAMVEEVEAITDNYLREGYSHD